MTATWVDWLGGWITRCNIQILLARTSNPTTVLAGEVNILSEEREGGVDTIISCTQCLRTEKEHPSASSGKLAKASKQHVKGEGQRVVLPGRQHN